jgi:hypothetical protein
VLDENHDRSVQVIKHFRTLPAAKAAGQPLSICGQESQQGRRMRLQGFPASFHRDY